MKKLALILTILFFTFGCSSTSQSNNLNNFVVWSVGSGVSKQSAKNNALENLAKDIFVGVKSSFNSTENLQNNKFNSSYTSNLNLQSYANFVGVSFFNYNQKNNSYTVTAGLSKQALLNTINYIYTNLNIDIVNSLDKYKANVELNNVNFLNALLLYAKSKNIATPQLNFKQYSITSYTQALQKKVNAQAIVKFVTNHKNATITLNSKTYKPFTEIYLPSGNFVYAVSLSNYITNTNSINLRNGDNLTLEVYLQKKLSNRVPVRLIVNNATNINTNTILSFLQTVANNNQMEVSKTANNTLTIAIDNVNVAKLSSSYYNLQTNVRITTNINNVIKTVDIPITYLSSSNVNNYATLPFNYVQTKILANTKLFFANLY